MHILDTFIPLWQCAIYYLILIVALYFSLNWARKNLDEKMVPLMSVLAAGIFAIMSMNMPVPFGTSGHMVGGVLVAIVFCAPEAVIIVFTLVLLVQGFFFADGGITALGVNVLNMGIIGGFAGLYIFKALRRVVGKYVAIGVASWMSIFIAAEVVAIELWLAGTFPLVQGLAVMGIYHVFIGIIEAVLTVVVIMTLEKLRPDLLVWNRKKNMRITQTETNEVISQ
ncbi:MAG: cobalt transporter CbiM [Methanobacterium sp.]|nr:cobalt transporter CbiM [Methanobacterium sp.]